MITDLGVEFLRCIRAYLSVDKYVTLYVTFSDDQDYSANNRLDLGIVINEYDKKLYLAVMSGITFSTDVTVTELIISVNYNEFITLSDTGITIPAGTYDSLVFELNFGS